MYSTSSTSSELLQDFLANFHSRKLLLYYKPPNQPSVTAAPPPYSQNTNLDKMFSWAAFDSNDNPPAAAVHRGIEQKSLKTFPVVNYSAMMNLPGLDTECVICLSEFVPGVLDEYDSVLLAICGKPPGTLKVLYSIRELNLEFERHQIDNIDVLA
ncbi:hypothetical protein CRYUN_Cryun24cG0027400 [Craigia yunnanensis]